jgi:hypothetical protein
MDSKEIKKGKSLTSILKGCLYGNIFVKRCLLVAVPNEM